MDHKRTTNAFIGSPVERIEDFRFLRGRGQFVDDLAHDDLLHAVILRSPVAHGRIRAIDTAAALARPGVHAVITAADIGTEIPVILLRLDVSPAFKPFEQPVIAHGKVRYVGEPVAVVLADSAAAAEDALDAIALDIEALPAVVNSAAAARNDVLLVEAAGTNLPLTLSGTRGDADAAFASAPYTRREKFSVQRHGAVPMEPRGLMAEWDEAQGRLTIYGAAKVAFANRRVLAQLMGLPEDAIRMVENDVGGGFGARGEFYPEDFLIPFAARSHRPAGQMDRGPPRASPHHQPCPRGRVRAGDRLRPRRHHSGLARPRQHRPGRLYPHQRRDPRAQHRAGARRSLSHPARAHRRGACHDQQDAGRHLSRARPLRS